MYPGRPTSRRSTDSWPRVRRWGSGRSRRDMRASRSSTEARSAAVPVLVAFSALRFLFTNIRNHALLSPSRLTRRGVARDRHDTRGGERWPPGCRQRVFGRADERQRADVKSQRADTPMLVSRAMRLKRIVRMVANKPGAPGRLRINVKTVAQGMPVDRHHLWYLPPALSSAGGPWVRPSPGIPCALRLLEGERDQHS